MTSGYTFGRPAKLKPPAEYKFKSFFSVATKDQVIDLSTSVTDEVGRRSTVPELPPQDPSIPCSSRSVHSAIANVSSNVVVVDVADTSDARRDSPRPIIENPGDDLTLVPARKRARRDNTAPWMMYFAPADSESIRIRHPDF